MSQPLFPLPLAEAEDAGAIFFWSAGLIVLVAVLFAAVVWLRRRLSPHEDFHGEGFTLSDLRRLHKEGHMTDEEFERAKAQLVASLQAAANRKIADGEKPQVRDYPDPQS